MRRFTELLLLAAYTPLVRLSFANGLQTLRSAVVHDALQKSGAIRGLLDTRQSFYLCLTGEYICETTHCCDIGWSCCSDGGCCQPQTYCDLASNRIIGCCPTGEVCTGPAGDPTTIRPDPTTTYGTTSTRRLTTTSTTTFTTLVGAPTQRPGTTIIEVSVLDVNTTWSENWVQGISSCSPSVPSKSTSTVGSSFTYIFQYPAVQMYGSYFWFNVANYNTKWEILVNGVSQETYYSHIGTNCTYFQSNFQSRPASTGTSASQNLTVVVHGLDGTATSPSEPWSFQFNKLLVQEENSTSTSTTVYIGFGTQTPGTPTGLASRRTQPYLPLLVFAGILSALLYCA